MMMPFHALLQTTAPDDTRVIAADGAERWTAATLRSAALSMFEDLIKRPESRWALIGDCPAKIAAGLLALVYAEKTVILPPNKLPGTLEDLSPWMEGLLTDHAHPELNLPCMALAGPEAAHTETTPPTPPDPETATLEFFTSGSTGTPKKVTKVLRQLEVEVEELEAMWGNALGQLPVFTTVSHQHIYGLLFRVLWPLCTGRIFQLKTHTYPEQLLQSLAADGPGVLVSSPAHLETIPDLIALNELRRVCPMIFSSGGPLSTRAASRFLKEFGSSPYEIFGSTETGGVAWRVRSPDNPDGIWTPFPRVQCELPDHEAPLTIRSPYLPDPQSPYTMKDQIRRAEGGKFILLKRNDRVVKIAEKRVALNDVEQWLCRHPWVECCAVAPFQRNSIRQRTVMGVAVVLSPEGWFTLYTLGRKAVTGELTSLLADHLEPVSLPRCWRFVDALPLNPQGKCTPTAVNSVLSAPLKSEAPVLPCLTVLERHPDQVRLRIRVPENLVYLKDHFPPMPVVPGVVLLDWAAQIGSAAFNCGETVQSLNRVKFQNVMLPGMKADLTLKWNHERNQLAFTYRNELTTFASGSFLLFPAGSTSK